ncbi:competence/damage-inducible protein A [Paenibacillus contaminans]|uniref:Putative competence-damage inducible protein n=1 Tax=Paenibacillus contaminans TaxID=450362 RepID=A0A329MS27_9BACL|nr:competence/damage-inducible protein A [Paenibacillus contaminans]RAV22779.1 competence/damage-inducible protein A [Paenibacillus contaminans]
MKAEIIAVGTELLMGQIVNTNAQFLSQQCTAIGVGVYYQTVVGDNESRLRQALETARQRADVIICTGGLGPTQDDLTKDVLAAFLNRSLIVHQPSMDYMTEFFRGRGIAMVESNAKQALMLKGSDPLPNDTGLAVGVALTQDDTHYILLPGPPKEMKPMFERYGTGWLLGLMGGEQPLYSKMLKFAGIGESLLEHKLIDLIDKQTDPTIAPYAKEGEVTLRLTTRAGSLSEADAKMADTEREIRERLGEYLYADRDVPIEQVIVDRLIELGLSLSAAESCTGGMLSDMITSVPGSSEAYHGGLITYTNRLKHALLGIPMELLEGDGAPGAISERTAREMAERLLERTGTDFALSVTGVAGPSPSEGKPVGLVYIGFARRGGETVAIETKQTGNRELIKLKASKAALYLLWKQLHKHDEAAERS